jgi:cytochrome c553
MRTLWLLTLAAACRSATADEAKLDPPKPEPTPSERFERDMMVRFHMDQNFDLLHRIERLLIRGRLDEAKRFADAIAIAPDDPSLQSFAAQTAVVRERAAALARATTVDDALRIETQLAAACGACHRDNQGAAMFEQPPAVPPDRPTIEARMARHRWAADRLWEAVVGDTDDAWNQGLDVLAAAPVDVGRERAPIAKKLQRLASKARRANAPAVARATTYGDILVVCSECHTTRSH